MRNWGRRSNIARRCSGRRLQFLPSPREAAGRGRGWGVPQQTRWQMSKLMTPTPDPSPPRARARGGRGAHCACLFDLAAPCARGLAGSFRPLQSEGAGNAGRPMRPIAACAMVVVERTRVSQVTPESPGIPRAMVLRLMSYSPRRSGFLVTVAPKKLASQELDAGVEASGPHDFAVRSRCSRQSHHQRPSHPAPRP